MLTRKDIAVVGFLLVMLIVLLTWAASAAPAAKADDGMVCPYPFTGTAVHVQVGVSAGGRFCDGPTEINATHFHCESGGGNVAGGGIGLAPFGGLTFGGLLSGGIGGDGGGCSWRCPDNTLSVQPNPPGAWKEYLVVRRANNSCEGHMTPAGPTSEPVQSDQGPPGFQRPDLLPPMVNDPLPTVTNPGQGNPDATP